MLKVSGNRITGSPRRAPASRPGARRALRLASNSVRKVLLAKRGSERSGAMPAMRFAIPARPGVPVRTFARRANFAALGAHSPIRPMNIAWRGRDLPS